MKDNRSLNVKVVNEMMETQLETLLESIRKTKQSASSGANEPVGVAENIVCIKCKRSCRTRSLYCYLGMHWTHYKCEKLSTTEITAIEQDNKNEYQCKICKAKIKGAIQTPVTKDVDLAREILDEEQDIALDCRSHELDTCSVCNNISNKQTLEYNDDNPTCTACIGIAHQYELLQLNSEISTTQNRENALEKSINEQTGLKTTIINNTQEDEPKPQSNI